MQRLRASLENGIEPVLEMTADPAVLAVVVEPPSRLRGRAGGRLSVPEEDRQRGRFDRFDGDVRERKRHPPLERGPGEAKAYRQSGEVVVPVAKPACRLGGVRRAASEPPRDGGPVRRSRFGRG